MSFTISIRGYGSCDPPQSFQRTALAGEVTSAEIGIVIRLFKSRFTNKNIWLVYLAF